MRQNVRRGVLRRLHFQGPRRINYVFIRFTLSRTKNIINVSDARKSEKGHKEYFGRFCLCKCHGIFFPWLCFPCWMPLDPLSSERCLDSRAMLFVNSVKRFKLQSSQCLLGKSPHPLIPVMRNTRLPLILVQLTNLSMLLESTVWAICRLAVPMPSQAAKQFRENKHTKNLQGNWVKRTRLEW